VEHGDFYGREITNGIIFVSDRQTEERKLIETFLPGDLLFHRSPCGLSALSRASSMPQRVSFPHWRYRECRPGERGYAVEIEPFLLPNPIDVKRESSGYIHRLTSVEVHAILRQIEALNPEIMNAEWLRAFFL